MSTLTLSLAAPLLMAGLLLVSGLVKLRAGERAQLGLHLPSVLEALAALCIGGLAVTGSVTPARGLWATACAALLVVGSSLHLWRRLAARRELRERTEARRLETFVRYLSESDSDGA